MDQLVYGRERSLGKITLVLGILAWLLLIVGTLGIALFYVLMAVVAYAFAQSAVIAWIKGTAVKLSPTQFPDLYQRLRTAAASWASPRCPRRI